MIKDIILHNSQLFLIMEREPDFKYERKGNWLIAEDSGFYSFFCYGKPSRGSQAFGGRRFDIPLSNGEIIQADGQWWDGKPEGYDHVMSIGVATVAQLERCYVFCFGKVERSLIDEWLKNNEPSNDYYKYEKKREA